MQILFKGYIVGIISRRKDRQTSIGRSFQTSHPVDQSWIGASELILQARIPEDVASAFRIVDVSQVIIELIRSDIQVLIAPANGGQEMHFAVLAERLA